ncbi:serum response factor-binding protein 1-like [Myxocyprinus asiaticus]|uniref:serum response factor-binding protein 1-like n=1 Tax=Myxocyprinus asiaticus TaxID=70543 RepID=UPI0022233151|nr:serum response factor-binding protein 1-like [Myxocyprinus asiaticus]
MSTVLNLSNEVVKMRVEVKRVKVLLIRKLIRQISVLEKKKGNEVDLERHRRRAARLREEIHELKVVAPDSITKAALQKDISFEKVCQNKEGTLSERAIARIATHPQFSKKIQSIKEAIKAFKEERINARKAEKQAKTNAEDVTLQDQVQEGSDEYVVGLEKSDDGEEKLTEEESEKNADKQQDEADGSSQLSQKTSLEMSNEQTNQCQKEQISTTENSAETVNIPDEMVRMRKEVKRTRVLIISKLTQKVAALKKKKGQESEVKENQEIVTGILKEIQALRSLKLDQVTKTALQENAELENVLQDPQANPLDRAIAHIITHSHFVNKLRKVKEAIEEERAKAAAAEQKMKDRKVLVQSNKKGEEEKDDDDEEEEEDNGDEDDEEDEVGEEKLNSLSIEIHRSGLEEPMEGTNSQTVKLSPSKVNTTPLEKPRERIKAAETKQKKKDRLVLVQSKNKGEEEEDDDDEEEEKEEEEEEEEEDDNGDQDKEDEVGEEKFNSLSIEIHKSGIEEPVEGTNTQIVKLTPSKVNTTSSEKAGEPNVKSKSADLTSTVVQSSPEKSSKVTSTECKLPKNLVKSDKEKGTTINSQKKQDVPEAKRPETEDDDEESDLSDDDDEKEYFDDSTEERFRKQSSQSEESDDDDFFLDKVSKFKKRKNYQGKVKEKKGEPQKPDNLQKPKGATSKPHRPNFGNLKSVFCSTLSKSSISSWNVKHGSWHDGPRPPHFQNQRKGPEGKMKASQYQGPDPFNFKPNTQTFKVSGERQGGPSGVGRGKSQFEQHKKQNPRGPSGNISNPPQHALHPSWEASRKRKEQQSQITAFQGKKIKFDDYD